MLALCRVSDNAAIRFTKPVASALLEGNSQSMSTPSRLYCQTRAMILFLKMLIFALLEVIAAHSESLPSPQPPTAINTFTLAACACVTIEVNLVGLGTAVRAPLPSDVGSTKE